MHRAYGAGHGIGLFYLSENLGLAHHHGIKTCSDPKEVADGVIPTIFVEVLIVTGWVYLKIFAEEATQIGAAVPRVRQQLNSIASGEDESFFNPWIFHQALHGVGEVR